MRIVLVMQDDPFYLPAVAQRLASGRAKDLAAVVLPSSRSQGAKRKMLRRSLAVYGYRGTARQGLRYVRHRIMDRIWSRGRNGRLYSVGAVARAHGIPILRPVDVNDPKFIAELRALEPDLIASVSAEQIFGPELLDLPRFGCINVHSSLLPKYRGLYPSFWVLANNERETGVTVHFMDTEIDNGKILLQRRVAIDEDDTQDTLLTKNKRISAELLLEAFRQMEDGTLNPRSNAEEEGTYFSFPTREDAKRFREHGKRFW